MSNIMVKRVAYKVYQYDPDFSGTLEKIIVDNEQQEIVILIRGANGVQKDFILSDCNNEVVSKLCERIGETVIICKGALVFYEIDE